MDNSWIKLYRKITQWEWFNDPLVFRLFIYLLLTANSTDKKWQGILIKRGQIITSYSALTRELTGKQQAKIGVQRIRTAITRLKSTGELTVKTTNKYSIITILNYDSYQSTNRQANRQATGKQQATNIQLTTTKEDKEDKKIRIKEDIIILPPDGDGINKVLDILFKINPTLNYENKANRESVRWLINKLGQEKTEQLTEYAISIFGQQYAPVITTGYQLKDKFSQLMAYYEKNKPKEIRSI